MLNPFEMLVPLQKQKAIVIINLKNKKEKKCTFPFEPNLVGLQLFSFKASNLTCIKEVVPNGLGTHLGTAKIKLTYFNFEKGSKELLNFWFDGKVKDRERYKRHVSIVNNFSLVAFLKVANSPFP